LSRVGELNQVKVERSGGTPKRLPNAPDFVHLTPAQRLFNQRGLYQDVVEMVCQTFGVNVSKQQHPTHHTQAAQPIKIPALWVRRHKR
jgi:hypothetical protein